VKKIVLSLCVAFGALFCAGCWSGSLLFVAEQPFWATLGDDARLRFTLARASLWHGYIPRFLLLSESEMPQERLARALGTGRFNTVIVGPFLSLSPEGFASRFPRTEFILVHGSPARDTPANTVKLIFDRKEAYRTAGYAAGLSERQSAAAGPARRIAILLPAGRGVEEDVNFFADGVAAAMEGGRPSMQEIEFSQDKAKVREVVEKMRKDGVEIFFPRLGALDSWCLEILKMDGGCAVVSDWASSGAFPEQVFLSVEDGVLEGIEKCLGASGRSEREEIGRVVNGPVKLVSGRARPIPDELKLKVETR
jgi:hypothetical protein